MSTALETLSEALFMGQVTDLATRRGWRWLHIEPGLTDRGRYRTPVKGSLGPGWPDLILIRGQRIIAAELKSQKGKPPTPKQADVLATIEATGMAETYVWKPSDWDEIEVILR